MAQAQQQQMAQQLRQMADQASELAKEMEPIARQNPSDRDFRDALQQLKQLEQDLRRAAAQGKNDPNLLRAAQQRIDDARRALDRSQEKADANNSADAAQQLADNIVQKQRQIENDMQKPMPAPGSADRAKREQSLAQRKDDLIGNLDRLEAMSRKIAQDAQKSSPEASRKFQNVANSLRDNNNLKDLIDFSKQQLSQPRPGNFEPQITAAAQKLAQQVANASQSMQQGQGMGSGVPADRRVNDLVKKAQSLADQARQQRQQQQQPQEQKPPQQQDQQQQQQQQNEQKKDKLPVPPQVLPKKKNVPKSGGSASGGGGGGMGRSGQATGKPVRSDETSAEVTRGMLAQPIHDLLQEAQQVRNDLQKQHVDVAELDASIRKLQVLEQGDYEKKATAEGGLDEVLENLKHAEFSLRRTMEKDAALQPVLGGNPDVPADYKPLVADYYKSLAEMKQ